MSANAADLTMKLLGYDIIDVELLASKTTSGVPTAAVGGAVLGPAGLVAGAIVGRKERRMVRIVFVDGREEVREVSADEHIALLKRKTDRDAFLSEQQRRDALSSGQREAEDAAQVKKERGSLWFTALGFSAVAAAAHFAKTPNWGDWFVWTAAIIAGICWLAILPSLFKGRKAAASA